MKDSKHLCWHFVMSSLSRIYGVNKVKNEEKFHAFALEWCDEHNYHCNIHLDSLSKVDVYFKQQYESWEQ
jgi:hypothetical protein